MKLWKLWLNQWAPLIVGTAIIVGVVTSAVVWQCSTPDRVPAKPGEIVSDPLDK